MKRLIATVFIGTALTITSVAPAFAVNPATDEIPDVGSIPVNHDGDAVLDAAPPEDAQDGLGRAEAAGRP